MPDPMTPERRTRLREALKRLRSLVERQGVGTIVLPDRRDMDALGAVVADVEDLLAEVERLRKALHNGRAERDKLRHELDEERERTTKAFVAQRRAERERDQTAERIEQAREDAVRHVERTTDAETERDRLAEQVKHAEAVCILLGWTAARQESTREKALHQLWRRWAATKPDDFMNPANHPDLSDDVIERLAQERDETQARTLAAIRGDGPEDRS